MHIPWRNFISSTKKGCASSAGLKCPFCFPPCSISSHQNTAFSGCLTLSLGVILPSAPLLSCLPKERKSKNKEMQRTWAKIPQHFTQFFFPENPHMMKHFGISTGPFQSQKSCATGTAAQTENSMAAFFPSRKSRLATIKARNRSAKIQIGDVF